MDPWSAVVDEVALEGLDGITIPTLWIRLENRQPKFPLKLDDSTKEFIWRLLIDNAELTFYAIPEEREDVVVSDRFKDADAEKIPSAHEKRKDIYPIHIIIKDGIQGSCAFFKERTDITKHVRSTTHTALISLEEALKRYGRKLVVVASQTLRFRALIGSESDPDLKLNDDSFCVLERVGRGRWQGELQNELHGSTFKADARKLHYMRKSLVDYGLISMQPFVSRKKTGQQQHSILLMLKRFHVNRRSKYDILMEYVSDILQHLPDQRGTLSSFREQLNLSDSCFKRVCRHMRDAKLVEFFQCPLEDLDPGVGPCTTKKGNKVLVRCMKLLKPYSKKDVPDDDEDDDDNDEDVPGARSRAYPPQGRIMERDVLTQAYHMILASGTKGVPQSGLGFRMNIGKLESRMLCRRLERDGLIKGFMVDEGRQRTTKFISHKCVGLSDQLQLVAKEQERKKLLFSSEPQASGTAAGAPKTASSSKSTAKQNSKTPTVKKIQKAGRGRVKGAKEAEQTFNDEGMDEGKGKARGKTKGRKSSVRANQMETETTEVTPAEGETPACSEPSTSMDTSDDLKTEQVAAEEEEGEQSNQTPADPFPQSSASTHQPGTNDIVVVKDVWEDPGKSKKSSEKSHETYRLLRRKNLIVEAVRNLKVIEGLFPLQKMINDEEKQFGFTCKCCKKTITRIVRSLSREGLLKMYTTTVIQDGITKNVEMIVHPSIQPNDEVVQRVIEQVRFRISSSYSNVRLQHEEKLRELDEFEDVTRGPNGRADKRASMQNYQGFKPTTVPGLGKTLGFQPKMHRLRIVHNFLWYLIYGHPLGRSSTTSDSTSETPAKPAKPAKSASSDPEAKCRDEHEKQDPKDSAQPQGAGSTVSNLDETSGEDEEQQRGDSAPAHSISEPKAVYTDEDSWKRFIPPVRVHKEFSSGWVMVADVLLCLPLSIFIQVIQINYKIEGLEEYLNDPVRQHYLVRWLPPKMRRQLLYRRKYLFSFHENLQKLVYMGLLQFGPSEKFMEKDQVFVYLKRHTTIVDTTNAEPHYWKIQEIPDKPFERRQYVFNTYEDVENYWFDLMCVCLNTPLGVIRSKRRIQASENEATPPFVPDRYVFLHLAYLLKGSREVCDDGSVPGDGKGAAGLDCEFFAHLKRNWLWTNHLLAVRKKTAGFEATQKTNRLKSLLSKHALRIALKAGGATAPRYLTTKKPVMTENVEVDIEPASRNQRVVGGKKQKRKRSKKEVVKVTRKKKKEPRKRTPAHDEADHRALKMMTRQRVYWSVQEDSLMMLCSVASHLLNSKLKRPFIPYCVVRDILHAEFEISMDKTSLAVGRRTRYILKNPQTLLNFRICLAEVYQDKSLMKLLEEKKPADPDKPEVCAEAFSEYARLLRQKFSSVINPGKMTMPDTKQQLFSRFKVSAIENGRRVPSRDTLNSTEDIHTIVLHNLIQSTLAMTNYQMKSSRSFQTFHMYSKYDQELLCQVFIQCRKRGLVNRRRVSQPLGPKKNRALPILPMSFQLSQSYYRCFSWRFPHLLCTDSFRFLRSLIDNGMKDDRPLTDFHHENELRLEGLTRGSNRKDKQGGEKAEDGAAKEPEPQPESLEVETVVNDEVMNRTDKEKNPAEDCVTASTCEDSSSMEQQTDDQPPKDELSNAAAEDPPDLSDMLQFSLESPGGACVVSLSLMALGLLSVHLSIPKQMVVVDSNLVDNDVVKSMAALEELDDDDYDGEECEGRKKLEVKAHQASHTNYLMMRGYCCPGIVKIRNLNTNDNIVVESCTMKLQLRNTPAHNVFSTENSPPLDLSKCGPSLLPSVLTYSMCSPSPSSSSCSAEECNRRLIERGYTPQDIEACARLRSALAEAGENGLDVRDLHQVHTQQEEPQAGCSRSLQQYMKDLKEDNQVLKVGGQGHRWVLTQHADPWLLTVNTKQWSQSYFKSHSMPFLENEHNIPFMRKRCRAESQQGTEEPPSKKPAVDGEGGEHNEKVEVEGGSSDMTREEVNKEAQLEKQKEAEEEGSGDKELNLGEEGGGQQMGQEEGIKEDAGQEKMEEKKEDAGEEMMEEGKEDAGEEKMEEGKEGVGEKKIEDDKEDTGQKMEEEKEDAGQEKMETEEGQKETRVTRARRRSIRAERDEEACSPLSAGEYVSFISRPWRMVDGTLNRQVCKGMLEGVMYHIMYRPGLTQQALVEHYKDVLQPVAVLDLVQALIDMGCLTKKTLVKGPKPSLFSRPVQPKKSEAEVETEEPDRVFYEPTISCCLRLSQVLPNERHWNNSAPSKCSSTPH